MDILYLAKGSTASLIYFGKRISDPVYMSKEILGLVSEGGTVTKLYIPDTGMVTMDGLRVKVDGYIATEDQMADIHYYITEDPHGVGANLLPRYIRFRGGSVFTHGKHGYVICKDTYTILTSLTEYKR